MNAARTRWLGRAGAAALVWGAFLGYGWLTERPSYPVGLAAAVAAALAVYWLSADVAGLTEPPQWSLYHSRSPSRTFDPRFSRLSQELADASDRRTAAVAVHTSVAAIADRTLLDKYDVDITTDVETAHRILGEQVVAFLATRPERQKDVFTPQLSEVLTRLESRVTELDLHDVSALAGQVLDRVEQAVVGKRNALGLILSCVLSRGHVLLEDFPGLGKTLAARSFAQTLGIEFKRAQFTPDLLPGDLTGSFIYDQRSGDFAFRRGPLFTGLLLADEINRTPPKTQAALLEAMQEGQITVEGETFVLPRPFHVLATANPVEYEGTYPLPEAQLDRFLMRVSFGYPTVAEERDVLYRRMARRQEEQTLEPVTDAATLVAMQDAVETVTVDSSVAEYCVALVGATRAHPHTLIGASPRGSLALMLTARGYAVIDNRDFVTPEDVKAVARSVLAHRITIKPELWMSSASGDTVVSDVLKTVPTPAIGDLARVQ